MFYDGARSMPSGPNALASPGGAMQPSFIQMTLRSEA
jgi:hypothetical protein